MTMKVFVLLVVAVGVLLLLVVVVVLLNFFVCFVLAWSSITLLQEERKKGEISELRGRFSGGSIQKTIGYI